MMKTVYTYKKCVISIVVAAMVLLISACAESDIVPSAEEQEVEVIFYPKLGNGSTRAIGDASLVDELIVVAVEDDATPIVTSMTWDDALREGVEIRLVRGRTYDLLFWAQCKDNGVYTVGKTVTADYDRMEAGFSGMQKLDAFYAVEQNVTVGTSSFDGGTITLRRPFAQLNLADRMNPAEQGRNYSVKMTVSGIATAFDPFSKTASVPTTTDFVFNDYENLSNTDFLTIDGTTCYYIASAYLFAPANVKVSYVLSEGGLEINKSDQAINVELKVNSRMNLYGEIILSDEVFDGTLAMRTPLAESYDAAAQTYLIDECDDLVWMSVEGNLAQLDKGNSFTITKDLDFASHEGMVINPVILPANTQIIGSGKTIRNARVCGGALFGDATGISISDLTVENMLAENTATTHVGTLVNTLRGSALFTNVTVTNATVTTVNGVAGGFVGYIVRTNETDRDEHLAVTFDNCHVEDVYTNGTISEGHFVGLLSGYDNGEILTFNANCTCRNVVQSTGGFTSPYREGNESVWLALNDYSKYDGWLGNEVYYRGIVNYGSNRFVPKWDGATSITPLTENDDTGSYMAIYSAFDLADLQGKDAGYVKFMEDVDLGGVPRTNEYSDKTLGNNSFNPIKRINVLEGNNKTIWNLYVEEHSEWTGFIKSASGTDTHRNITFENATVICHYITDEKQDMGYAGALTPFVNGAKSYIVENVRVNNSLVFGLGKIGGLIGFVSADTQSFRCKDSSVSNSTVKNIEGTTDEVFLELLNYKVTFKAHGEAGGLIGMIMGNADIDDCRTTGVTMDCYGVDNWKLNVLVASADVPGRYVNQFIGNIRTVGGSVSTIDNCTVSGNTYLNREDNHSSSVKIIGEAYYLYYKVLSKIEAVDTKGSVKVDGMELLK